MAGKQGAGANASIYPFIRFIDLNFGQLLLQFRAHRFSVLPTASLHQPNLDPSRPQRKHKGQCKNYVLNEKYGAFYQFTTLILGNKFNDCSLFVQQLRQGLRELTEIKTQRA